jgi:hypothetical protein
MTNECLNQPQPQDPTPRLQGGGGGVTWQLATCLSIYLFLIVARQLATCLSIIYFLFLIGVFVVGGMLRNHRPSCDCSDCLVDMQQNASRAFNSTAAVIVHSLLRIRVESCVAAFLVSFFINSLPFLGVILSQHQSAASRQWYLSSSCLTTTCSWSWGRVLGNGTYAARRILLRCTDFKNVDIFCVVIKKGGNRNPQNYEWGTKADLLFSTKI